MKSKILLTAILTFVLVSCAPISISTPTETPAPTKTLTPIPPTPTITPLPTETPDPNMPSDATGKDANGYYKDVQENGKTIRYYWVELNYGDNIEESIFKGWFASHMINGSLNGAIPLYDVIGKNKMVPLYYYVQQGIQAPYIKHLGSMTNYANEIYYDGFSYKFESELESAYLGKDYRRLSDAEMAQFDNDFTSGKISFPFTTPIGNYIWKLTQTIGYKFYAVKWDDINPATHSGLYETQSGKFKYRWAIYSDKEGNLVVIEAVNFGDAMDAQNLIANINDPKASAYFLDEILFPMQQMLDLRQLPAKIKNWQGRFYTVPVTLAEFAFRSICGKGTLNATGKQIDYCNFPQFEIVQNP